MLALVCVCMCLHKVQGDVKALNERDKILFKWNEYQVLKFFKKKLFVKFLRFWFLQKPTPSG